MKQVFVWPVDVAKCLSFNGIIAFFGIALFTTLIYGVDFPTMLTTSVLHRGVIPMTSSGPQDTAGTIFGDRSACAVFTALSDDNKRASVAAQLKDSAVTFVNALRSTVETRDVVPTLDAAKSMGSVAMATATSAFRCGASLGEESGRSVFADLKKSLSASGRGMYSLGAQALQTIQQGQLTAATVHLLVGALTILMLFLSPFATYGKLGGAAPPSWLLSMLPRWAWMSQELPTLICLLVSCILFGWVQVLSPAVILFAIHYTQRTFVYPALVMRSGNRVSVQVTGLATLYCSFNGALQTVPACVGPAFLQAQSSQLTVTVDALLNAAFVLKDMVVAYALFAWALVQYAFSATATQCRGGTVDYAAWPVWRGVHDTGFAGIMSTIGQGLVELRGVLQVELTKAHSMCSARETAPVAPRQGQIAFNSLTGAASSTESWASALVPGLGDMTTTVSSYIAAATDTAVSVIAKTGAAATNRTPSVDLMLLGIIVFFAGMIMNVYHDVLLSRLRATGSETTAASPKRTTALNGKKKPDATATVAASTHYRIPYGGCFHWLCCPNLVGEMIEWTGFAVCAMATGEAAPALAAVSFAVYTISNIGPRAVQQHSWYCSKFGDRYRKLNRKRLIPYVY